MRYTHNQEINLLRMKHIIEDIHNGKHKEYAPLEVSGIRDCYEDFTAKRKTSTKTILENVADAFATCGFNVTYKGMEWVIAL